MMCVVFSHSSLIHYLGFLNSNYLRLTFHMTLYLQFTQSGLQTIKHCLFYYVFSSLLYACIMCIIMYFWELFFNPI